MKKSERKRYHIAKYFPPWAEKSLEEFIGTLQKKKSITFSAHAVDKLIQGCFEYGYQLLRFCMRPLRKNGLDAENVFEFYAVDEFVQKAVFRFSFEEFPVDVILVISVDGTVITMYTTNKNDNHDSLDASLYERKP